MSYTKQWHVIFRIKNADGVVRDYCREQPPLQDDMDAEFMVREMTFIEVEAWAHATMLKHNLHSYDIQYW